ncbi:MAG TPA: glycosyltransferase [Steroidobacteraceae bacterium]|nr:glycosyltransferase [Steroidobacteraceae bacterium]
MPPVHVCHLVLSLEPGGLENGVVNVVNGLSPAEFRSSVCCLQRSGEFAARLRPDVPVSVMGLRPGNDPVLPLRLAKLLRKARVDIVHTRNAEPFFYGYLAARLARIPVVVHSEHGRTFPEQPLRAMVQRLLMRGVDAAFAVSTQLRADLVRELGIDGSRMEVLYNGVDTGSFRPLDAPCQGSASGERLRIGSVGRLVPVKNYTLLLNAFARLPPDACQLILVGEGPERGALERLADDLRIRDRVEFAGHRDDVPDLLRTLDIFVLPSLSEGMSNTLLEAMATGVAAVASDVGGNREIIESERSGLLFPSGDTAAAAAQLQRLIASRELRRAVGGAGAARVRGTFSIEAMLGRYAELYRRLWRDKRGEMAGEAAA